MAANSAWSRVPSDDCRTFHHRLHFSKCNIAGQILQSAVGRDDDPFGWDERQRSPDAGGHRLARFDRVVGQVKHAQDDRLRQQLPKHREIELRLRRLDRNLIGLAGVELGQERIAGRLGRHPRRIAEAQMDGGRALGPFQRPVDRGNRETARLVGLGLQERLIELDHVGARRRRS